MTLLKEAVAWRREAVSAPILGGLFGRGGYQHPATLRERGCELPDDLRADSANRRWFGLQFNGNTQPPVHFMRGVDVAMPQLLLSARGGSHSDQPSCDRMASSSPHSPTFERRGQHTSRATLLWFGGHPGHGSARTQLFRRFRHDGLAEPGFVLADSLRGRPEDRRDAVNMSLGSVFCWVPRGQGDGDPTRHMVAIFHGCVPVFTLGASAATDDALPFEELLPWSELSLRVPSNDLSSLPSRLWEVAADGPRLRAMQAKLGCAWRSLFWSSLVGSCFGEPTDDGGDAYGALMAVLRARLLRRGSAALGGCAGVPRAASSAESPPGADPALLRLRPT